MAQIEDPFQLLHQALFVVKLWIFPVDGVPGWGFQITFSLSGWCCHGYLLLMSGRAATYSSRASLNKFC
jgi:hypothetical protein